MDIHVSDVLVTGFEDLVPSLELPDPGDRHVLAAAIRAEADIIVTANLKDFPASSLAPHGLEAEHPDAFLARLCGRWPVRFVEALHRVRGRLRHPPLSRDEHLRALRRSGLRATVEEIVARTVSLPPPGTNEEDTLRKARSGRKPRISPVVMARDFLGMAIEEIRVARTEESIGTQDGNVYARNKALQSAGMGVELVYKALILAQGRTPIGSGQKGHRIEVLHGQLSGTDKEELQERIRDAGWTTASDWCRYLDDR